jgi:CBS domain-containing protein
MSRDRPEVSPESITQQTRIEDADKILGTEPITAHARDSLGKVAQAAVQHPACRVIAVVDDEKRLLGVIPVRVLLNDIFLKIVPEEFLGEITDVEAVMKYAAHIGARTAADIMLEPVAVHHDDTVKDAFERMHAAKLNGLPIVDAENRVIGYIDQLELLMVWVRASGRGRLLRPDDEDSPG